MHFSEKEKKIIKSVVSGEIYDLQSYLSVMVPLKEEINTWGSFMGGNVSVMQGENVKMVEGEDALVRELSFFIALCCKLQSVQLLQVLENATTKVVPKMLMRQPVGASIPSKISNLFAKNMHFEIVPFNELNQFIADDFLTVEERNLQDERNAREEAQKTTVIVAIVSLLISTATSVGVTYFNYKTYSTERKVSISNLDVIKYPIPVSITESPNQVEGATKSSNSALKREVITVKK